MLSRDYSFLKQLNVIIKMINGNEGCLRSNFDGAWEASRKHGDTTELRIHSSSQPFLGIHLMLFCTVNRILLPVLLTKGSDHVLWLSC